MIGARKSIDHLRMNVWDQRISIKRKKFLCNDNTDNSDDCSSSKMIMVIIVIS